MGPRQRLAAFSGEYGCRKVILDMKKEKLARKNGNGISSPEMHNQYVRIFYCNLPLLHSATAVRTSQLARRPSKIGTSCHRSPITTSHARRRTGGRQGCQRLSYPAPWLVDPKEKKPVPWAGTSHSGLVGTSPVFSKPSRLKTPGTPPIHQLPPCLLYTSPSPRDKRQSRMPSSA